MAGGAPEVEARLREVRRSPPPGQRDPRAVLPGFVLGARFRPSLQTMSPSHSPPQPLQGDLHVAPLALDPQEPPPAAPRRQQRLAAPAERVEDQIPLLAE